MAHDQSRRSFLRSAPLAAAAAALPFTEMKLSAEAPAAVPFQLFTAGTIAEDIKLLDAKPGNNNLFENPALPFTVVLTTEKTHAAKEFEWHEGRDHVLQVLEGETVYEVGGTPVGAHSSKPMEWNSPSSTGSTRMTLKKGDMLVIPRNTLHKRTTETSVTFYLISTTGEAKS